MTKLRATSSVTDDSGGAWRAGRLESSRTIHEGRRREALPPALVACGPDLEVRASRRPRTDLDRVDRSVLEATDPEGDVAASLVVDDPTAVGIANGAFDSSDAEADAPIDRRSILDLDSQRRAQITAAGQHFLDEHESDRIVDMIHHVEVGEAQGPSNELETRRRAIERQTRRHTSTGATLSEDCLKFRSGLRRSQRRGVEVHPQRGGMNRALALVASTDIDAPFGPARPDARAPRHHVERLEVGREPVNVYHCSPHNPRHLSKACVARIVVGKVL
jgi:hypothetical protein